MAKGKKRQREAAKRVCIFHVTVSVTPADYKKRARREFEGDAARKYHTDGFHRGTSRFSREYSFFTKEFSKRRGATFCQIYPIFHVFRLYRTWSFLSMFILWLKLRNSIKFTIDQVAIFKVESNIDLKQKHKLPAALKKADISFLCKWNYYQLSITFPRLTRKQVVSL